MRGKAWPNSAHNSASGITPAYAGKRADAGWIWSRPPDHPRMCGEKRLSFRLCRQFLGSPPHVRGKGVQKRDSRVAVGITPAYAGKSELATYRFVADWDHPRVCGEKVSPQVLQGHIQGSPPRMRGKEQMLAGSGAAHRITPAYAGKRSGR